MESRSAPLQEPKTWLRRSTTPPDRSRSPGRLGPADGADAAPGAAGGVHDNDNMVKVCSETFCFQHVQGVLLREGSLYKKHEERLQSVQGGVGNFESVQKDMEEFQQTGQG